MHEEIGKTEIPGLDQSEHGEQRLWYVVQTKPSNEERVKGNLLNQEIETFLPLLGTYEYSNGNMVQRIKPLFSSYLFARLDLMLENPKSGVDEFHTGLDISSRSGNPVRATADGIVSFTGWNGGNGNLVVLEHGFGFSTFYAHNRMNAVKAGQKVKRGEVISYVGSTGSSTGPHVHYEIWKNGNPVNPKNFGEGSS